MSLDDPVGGDSPELVRDVEWQRLDPRMLLVHPINEVMKFLPALIGLFVAGSATGGRWWQYVGIAVPIAVGFLRYLTTSFRVSSGRVELRRGLLSRHLLSTPLDRVRTVDLTSPLIHRLLGLTMVRVGTGTASTSDDDQLSLDGLPVERAQRLRAELLRSAQDARPAGSPEAGTSTGGLAGPPGGSESGPHPPARVVLRLDPAWMRFAPLTSSGLVIAAAVVGVLSQGVNMIGDLPGIEFDEVTQDVVAVSVWVIAPLVVVALLVISSLAAVVGYAVLNWGFTLTRDPRSWHLSRGLLTTRETTVDQERLAGVTVHEPAGLRLAGGGRLSAVVTGLDRSQQGSSVLVPPAPRAVVDGVAGEVLGDARPVRDPLIPHGPRARRRRFTRALGPVVAVGVVLLALMLADVLPGWPLLLAAGALLAATLLAADRARALGHALIGGYLVARSGSLVRERSVLDTDHVIGWTFRSTWFQRRAGLTHLSATTAGGPQRVQVIDLPETLAVRLTTEASPALLSQFLRASPPN